MSYILNALKKAERDRLRDDPQKLDDFTSTAWDPYQPVKEKKISFKITFAIVGTLIGLLVAVYSTEEIKLFHQERKIDNLRTDMGAYEQTIEDELQAKTLTSEESRVSIEEVADDIDLETNFLIAGHMFIEKDSPLNRLFIGDGSYREGDTLDDTWLLVAINADHYIIQSGTRIETISYR